MSGWLSGKSIALSVSPPENLASNGMGPEHLDDALAEISRQLLALGARLIYGGDLRAGGVTNFLFELAARYAPPVAKHPDDVVIIDVLPFPSHAGLTQDELIAWESEFAAIGELRYLGPRAEIWSYKTRPEQLEMPPREQWADAFTAMREYVTRISDARIVLGGKQAGYLGRMPGILEEALVSADSGQPLFAIGGFGGAAQAIAQKIALNEPVTIVGTDRSFSIRAENGLTPEESRRLATSPHIDEVTVLLSRGLRRLFAS